MKKFIVKIISITILILGVNFLYLQIIQQNDWNFKKRLEAINLENPKYDILVIGNSLAMDGIDTKYMSENGFQAYNLAIGGATLKTNYVQLKEYLSTYDYKPKLIILGVGTYMNSFDGDQIHPIVD